MFNLIRRISYGVIPRPDRPWEDDATSNAPAPRKKRRLSSTERDERHEEEITRQKKARSDSQTPGPDADLEVALQTPLPPQAEPETQEVKEMTQGVKEVDLGADEKGKAGAHAEERAPDAAEEERTGEKPQENVLPESIPLPDEVNGELDAPEDGGSPLAPNVEATVGASVEGEPSTKAEDAISEPDVSQSKDAVAEEGKQAQATDAEAAVPAPAQNAETNSKEKATATITTE